jgi:group I intron endonuclease
MIGIYRIRNVINGKCYYGSSKNIEKRWVRHKNDLNKNKHINCILQRAWEKYGEDNFIFEVVEECEVNMLFQIEQKYIDLNPEYNIGLKSSGGDNLTNNPKREIIIENIKIGTKKWLDGLTDKEKKEKFSKPLDKNPNWRGGRTYSYCECGKKIGYGHTHCNKCRPRSNTNNPFYGRTHSKEVKDKAKERMIGNIPSNRSPIVINDVNYESYNHASKCLNIPVTTIRWRVLSKNPKYKNYNYKGHEKISYNEEEQSKRLGNPQIGRQRSFNKPFTIDNVKYRTLKEASEKLNIHPMTIKGRLKSEKFENYKYEAPL